MPSLYTAKLAGSGITEEQGTALGFEYVPNAKDLSPCFWNLPALKISYGNGFYRVRRLAGLDSNEAKYLQLPDTGPNLYKPSCKNWELFMASGEPLIITEGELKAAKCALEGFWCVALGGVHSFKQSKKGVLLIPDLKSLVYKGLKIYVIFDSDIKTNKNICNALNELAIALTDLNCNVYTVYLSDRNESKVGLDDFLVYYNKEVFEQLLEKAWPLSIGLPMLGKGQRFLQVKKPMCVLDKDKLLTYTIHDFRAIETWPVSRIKATTNGPQLEQVSFADAWLSWQGREMVDSIDYMPGQPEVVVEKGFVKYNFWRGWGVEPVQGDVGPFYKLFNYVFHEATPEFREWVLQWMAYPLQHPGTKLYTSLLVISPKQGTGKSFIGEILGDVYGNYTPAGKAGHMSSTSMSNDVFKSAFNGSLADKLFVRVEEVIGDDAYASANKVKNMITQSSIVINKKGVEAETRIDRINYYITSNYLKAAKLDTSDRRFAVHVMNLGKADDSLYKEVDTWRNSSYGIPALLFHLLNDIDTSNFNPKGEAISSEGKAEVIDAGLSTGQAWAKAVFNDPSLLTIGGKLSPDLLTSKELLSYFEFSTNNKSYSSNRLAAICREAGFARARQVKGMVYYVNVKGRPRDIYFIVRNVEKWLGADLNEMSKYLEAYYADRRQS